MTAPDANRLMVDEARLALDAYSHGDLAGYDTHRLNARRLADALGMSAQLASATQVEQMEASDEQA